MTIHTELSLQADGLCLKNNFEIITTIYRMIVRMEALTHLSISSGNVYFIDHALHEQGIVQLYI